MTKKRAEAQERARRLSNRVRVPTLHGSSQDDLQEETTSTDWNEYMGLFDDYDIDMDEVKAAGGFDIDDGHYDFVIAEALVQNGTKRDPDDTKFIIKYDLNDGEAGTYWEWFTIAVDGDPEAAKAATSLGFLKNRLLDLGIPAAELNSIEPEDLEGISGTLELKTTQGKGKNAGSVYQNIRNVKVGAVAEPEPEPVEDVKKLVAAKRAASKAEHPAARKTATVKRSAQTAEDVDEDNPFA